MRIKLVFIGFISVLAALWALVDTLFPQPLAYFSFRSAFMQLSGALAIGMMSLAMTLAVRPLWLERHLDGLDKMYRLHKWLGIGALAVGVMHWWMGRGTKWMVGWGWLTRPARKGMGQGQGQQPLDSLESWFGAQRGFAETVGEWAFYGVVILIVLALVKRFPYHLFARTHKWISVGYLLLVLHSVLLIEFAYWSRPIGWVLAVLMLSGGVAACLSLLGRIGASRKAHGTILNISGFPALKMTETQLQLDSGWAGHESGQFAFVTSNRREGAHPYTIASAWNPADRTITFLTKALGDHTAQIPQRLRVGMPVVVEGPYGCFTFGDKDGATRQIWIGAGIGITPFIARMKHLSVSRADVPVDLFHPTAMLDPDAMVKLGADAQASGVQLHVIQSPKDGYLDGNRIRQLVPDWESASLWFCGPAGFGKSLREDMVKHGLGANRFHQELFEMR